MEKMKIKLKHQGFEIHAKLLRNRIVDRIPAIFSEEGMLIAFSVDDSIGSAESYKIEALPEGWKIIGADELGLYYGIGKFLHTAKWSVNRFEPVKQERVVIPACDYRVIDYVVHFYNWYQTAPIEELERYLEDLLLWGYNTVHCSLPIINLYSFEDQLFVDSVARVRQIFSLAKKFGMKTELGLCPNKGLKSAPGEYDNDPSFNLQYRGNLGRNLCLSKPAAFAYVRNIWRVQLEQFTDIGIDFVTTWPYDEGGCGCPECRPWGANKYCDGCMGVREETHKLYPNAKVIVSTWAFDMPDDEGEYAGLYKRLKGDMSWVDYIMVDAHGAFPRYPLEHEPVKPIVNFPEISMWGLAPWGGFGANPLPDRFQGIWDSCKHIVKGGMPYSEGIYEDISKVQYVGYYWEPDRHYREILAEYINYEYSGEVIDEVFELMNCIERNHTLVESGTEPEIDLAVRGAQLAESVNEHLDQRAKSSWRWRILYIRAILDKKRYLAYQNDKSEDPKKLKRFMYYSGDLLLEDEEAQKLFLELQGYYHCVEYNGENHHTLPPAGGTKLDVVV